MSWDFEVFIAGLIHALNNPLTYVQTNLTSLRRDVADILRLVEAYEALLPYVHPDRREEVERALRLRRDLAMDRPAEMMDRLLADCQDGLRQVQVFLKATRGVPQRLKAREAAPFDGDEWVAAAAERQGRQGHPVPEIVAGARPLGLVTAVRAQWDELLDLLLQNAREAAAGRPEPRVRLVAGDRTLTVEDNGPGVLAGARPHVFLPYFAARPNSVGLGLWVATALARGAGGTLELDPAPSDLGGARFVLRLPAG